MLQACVALNGDLAITVRLVVEYMTIPPRQHGIQSSPKLSRPHVFQKERSPYFQVNALVCTRRLAGNSNVLDTVDIFVVPRTYTQPAIYREGT